MLHNSYKTKYNLYIHFKTYLTQSNLTINIQKFSLARTETNKISATADIRHKKPYLKMAFKLQHTILRRTGLKRGNE